jgi:FK506-binding nuclear protein
LNITIGENERVYFQVSGTHSIFLTGNYVEPAHNHDHDEEDDEEDYSEDEYDSEDDLDDMEDPRITEITEEDEAPKLVEATKKGKKSLDSLISEAKAEPTEKLSKKQAKKAKKNDGTAVAVEAEEAPSSAKSDKKVQFAKNLEQGPTPTKATPAAAAEKPKAAAGPRVVSGVTIDDKKAGTGPAAKNGDRVGMRYIGKLQKNNKVFDSNKKGKPFTFKLGSGEVIKGWDIGVAGMAVGAERRITIPAHHAYGARGAPPDIPGGATLVFDVKVVEINKGK